MAPTPSRRRKIAKATRDLALADAAAALVRRRGDRGRKRRGRLLLLIGGAIAAACAAIALKRDRIAGMLASGSEESSAASRQPSYDASDAAADTVTPAPAPATPADTLATPAAADDVARQAGVDAATPEPESTEPDATGPEHHRDTEPRLERG